MGSQCFILEEITLQGQHSPGDALLQWILQCQGDPEPPAESVLPCQDFFLQEQGNAREQISQNMGRICLVGSCWSQLLPWAERLKGGMCFPAPKYLGPRACFAFTAQSVRAEGMCRSCLHPLSGLFFFFCFIFSSFHPLVWFCQWKPRDSSGNLPGSETSLHLHNTNTLSKHLPLTSPPGRKQL